MRRAARTVVLLLLTPLLLLSSLSRTDAAPSDPFAAQLESCMPDLLKAYGVPGASVAYIQDGEVVWSQGYGLADRERKTPMTAGHIFAHGSDGKVIAAWAVLRLVDEGKVDLDAPVERYLKRWKLPASPYDASKPTVRMLLNHTSGLEPGHYRVRPIRFDHVEIVDSLNGLNYGVGPARLTREPGTAFNYFGAGFAVAQVLVEDVTGEAFEAFTNRVIFGPLVMTTAAWHWTPELEARAATPYGAKSERLPFYDLSEAAVGSEMMTAADYARFVAAAVPGPKDEPAGRGVLKPETVSMAMTPQAGANTTSGLGYGTGKLQNGQRYVMHLGGDPGWRAGFILQPESRDGFVIATNSDRADSMLLEVMDIWSRTTQDSPLPLAPNFKRIITDPDLPLRNLLLIVTAVLGVGLIYPVIGLWRQVRSGTRRRDPDRRTRGVIICTAYAVLAWLTFGMVGAWLPKRRTA